MSPKASVIIPSYNSANYIKVAIESVIGQTFKDWELIIVDDCSSDDTIKIVKEFLKKDKRVKLSTSNKNIGPHKNMNRGLDLCKGEYIVKLDADDYMYSHRIEKQVNFLDENKDVGVLGGAIEVCDENLNFINTRKYPITDEKCKAKLFYYSPFAHPAVTFRKSVFEKCDKYDPNISMACDIDLWFRLGLLTKLANLEDIIVKYRVHHNSISQKNIRKQELETLEVRRKAVQVYGYKMNTKEKIYNFLQYVSVYLIPSKIKFKVFNLMRKYF